MLHRRPVSILACLIAFVAATGCSSHSLMRTPLVVANGLLDPYENTPPELQTSDVPVFVAAPRELAERDGEAGSVYSIERSQPVRLGRGVVTIGDGLSWGEITTESRALRRSQDVRVRFDSYEDYGTLWSSHLAPNYGFTRDHDFAEIDRSASDRWITEVNDQLATSRQKQIYIYVHGFNTTFESNTEICAEFWHYMARDGVMMSFDWPSRHSLFSYQQDKANSEVAIRQFRVFLDFLARESDADRINILAHSAGTRVVVEALRDLSLRYYDLPDEEAQAATKIGRVILAAPDMDFWVAMSAAADGIGRITEGIMGYASRSDKALGLSGNIFGEVRLGNAIGKLPQDMIDNMIERGSLWVDATAAQKRYSSFLGHSYYHQNPIISSDVMLFLAIGASPEDRGLTRDTKTGFLVFPDDYEERLGAMVQNIEEEYEVEPDDDR